MCGDNGAFFHHVAEERGEGGYELSELATLVYIAGGSKTVVRCRPL